MIQKLNRILSIALILAVVGIGTVWVLQRAKPVTSRISTVEKASSQMQTAPDSREWVQNYLKKQEFTEAENQKVEQVLKSQAYQDFLKTDVNSMKEFLDFFASQGVEIPYTGLLAEFHQMFREHFPQASAAELEPYMREKLSALFWENNIQFGTEIEYKTIEEIIIEFFVENPNIVWAMEHFEGDYFAIGRWATDVLQNPIPAPTEEPDVYDTREAPLPAQGEFFDAEPDVHATEQQYDREPVQSATSPSIEDLDTLIESEDDIFADNEDDIKGELTPESPEPTEETLETYLHRSFSPARFKRAMETLRCYGPQEGLRHLKTSDPEFAEYVTRFLRKHQENEQ